MFNYFEFNKVVKKLVREILILPSQNFSSRIERPDSEICCRIQGSFKITSLAIYGMKLFIDQEPEETENLSFWCLFSNLLEHSTTYSLLQNTMQQCLVFTKEGVADDMILEEQIWGKSPEEIFGFLLAPETKKELQDCFRFYLKTPRTPKRTQRHRGYRDKGSLGGDKEFLKARNFDNDDKIQMLIEQKRKFQYTFKELEQLLGIEPTEGRSS